MEVLRSQVYINVHLYFICRFVYDNVFIIMMYKLLMKSCIWIDKCMHACLCKYLYVHLRLYVGIYVVDFGSLYIYLLLCTYFYMPLTEIKLT